MQGQRPVSTERTIKAIRWGFISGDVFVAPFLLFGLIHANRRVGLDVSITMGYLVLTSTYGCLILKAIRRRTTRSSFSNTTTAGLS